MSKQDRQGVRTASDLERKYQYEKQFAEVMGISLDTQRNVTQVESSLSHEIYEQMTSLTRDTQALLATALESYLEKEGLEEFRKTLKTEFGVWAEGIAGRVTATEEDIQKVDNDLQEKFNTIVKYFTFDINGLTIGQIDNPNKVVIDNDEITIYVGNKEVVTFKADGSGVIPILNVTANMTVVGLQITEDSTHINCEYVGG